MVLQPDSGGARGGLEVALSEEGVRVGPAGGWSAARAAAGVAFEEV